jgi:hypothetical protein
MMASINVYQTASAIRFADAVLRIGQQYDAASRCAADTQSAIEGAERLEMDTTAMHAIHAADCKRADTVYATLMILLADVPTEQVFAGPSGGWRVRVEWRPLATKDRLNVYAQMIED